tara:strand:- start:203 stop:655 length:453 start_codon:yes stop_codon:yes gene_type:complete
MNSKKKIHLFKNFFINCFLTLSVLIIYLITPDLAYSLSLNDMNTSNTVIEHLRFHVPSDYKEAWLKAEKGSWGKWLSNKSGFLGRELFWDPENQKATILIKWSSKSIWKSIPQEEINLVQTQFEELAREGTTEKYGNPFPLEFEGELIPQ